ncbi:serine/threonine protein kinase, partial [Caminibacter sp.]
NLKKDEIIDGYRLIEPLIQNERTWLVEKKGKKYVLKFPPLEAVEDEKILDLFIKEAWNARRLKVGFFPKAIIPKKRSYQYYVMEYIEGENLKGKKLKVEEALKLAKTLLRMSQYLLKIDLVHGDIKPENIIKTKTFKVVDFGSIVEIFSINSRAGTPSYLAPERLKGEAISEASEIFSIGVTLYELLTGRLPYGEIEPFSNPVFKKARRVTYYNKNVPLWLEAVIMRAIEVDKFKRYQNYSEMMYELSNPDKVKPYFEKVSILDIDENSYKKAFFISLIINFILAGIILFKI